MVVTQNEIQRVLDTLDEFNPVEKATLAEYLPWEEAFLHLPSLPGDQGACWTPKSLDSGALRERLMAHVNHGIDKAEAHDHRGVRTALARVRTLTWLLGKPWRWLDDYPFDNFGCPKLMAVIREFRLKAIPGPESGETKSWFMRMAAGQACQEDWVCGCLR